MKSRYDHISKELYSLTDATVIETMAINSAVLYVSSLTGEQLVNFQREYGVLSSHTIQTITESK